MTKNYETALRESVRLLDVVAIFVSFYLALFIRNSDWFAPALNELIGRYLPLPITATFDIVNFENILWFLVPLWLFLLSYSQSYSFNRIESYLSTFVSLIKVHIAGGFFIGMYILVTSAYDYSRFFFLMFILLSLLITFAIRAGVQFWLSIFRSFGNIYNRAIIIGTGEKASNLIKELQDNTYWGFHIVGLMAEENFIEGKFYGYPVLGSFGSIGSALRKWVVDDVFIAIDAGSYSELKAILKTCENIGVNVHLIPDKYDLGIAHAKVGTLGNTDFITFATVETKLTQKFFKRVIDLTVSIVLLVPLLLLFIVIGILIKMESPGKVFYKSIRVTRNRRPFFIYKFRTMFEGASDRRDMIAGKDQTDGAITKVKDDPRVSNIGRFLRKYSIDELPQIINVILGEMSLVGPRPPLPDEVEKYTLPQLRKLSMPQGMTGLWQVTGRDSITKFEDRLKLDLEYIDNWSLWLDIKILFKTIFVVFKGSI